MALKLDPSIIAAAIAVGVYTTVVLIARRADTEYARGYVSGVATKRRLRSVS